jgi:hypothetical protein
MMPRFSIATLAAVLVFLAMQPAFGQAEPKNDLRDIAVGMPVDHIPNSGYANLTCVKDNTRKLAGWSAWRECPTDVDTLRAIRFEFDPETSREGTIVAGHPVLLTAFIDDLGAVDSLRIDTDPKARLFLRKKAFLLGVQVKSRYGTDGWACSQQQPENGEQPVGGIYLRETCRKSIEGRTLIVDRNLFRRADQDTKNFVDQTQVKITRRAK